MSQSASPVPAVDLSYASPAVPLGPRVWAGVGVTLAGLILIGFGGCFMIGVLIQLHPEMVFGPSKTGPWSPLELLLHGILYLMALACSGSGALLVWRGTRSLFRVIGEKP